MIKHIHKVKSGFEKGQSIILNPFEFILDWIIRIIAQLFIPIPLAGEILVQFKGVIIAILLNFALLGIILFLAIIGAISNPSLTKKAIANTTAIVSSSDCSKMDSTDTPQQNPLGGHLFGKELFVHDYLVTLIIAEQVANRKWPGLVRFTKDFAVAR